MARRPFGGGPADFVAAVTSQSLLQVGTATVTFWTAPTGGTQVTDLLLTGTAVSQITTLPDGTLPAFSGPANGADQLWAQAGGARRSLLQATDVGARLAAVEQVQGQLAGYVLNADQTVKWRLVAPDTDASTATPILVRVGAVDPATGGGSGGGTSGGTTGGGGGGDTPTTSTTTTTVANTATTTTTSTASIPAATTGSGDGQWTYSGDWHPAFDHPELWHNGSSIMYCTTAGDYAQLLFTGTGISFWTNKNTAGPKIDVTIDGTPVSGSPFDMYAATTVADTVLFTVTGLSLGQHTLKLTARSDANASSVGHTFLVDQADVTTTNATSNLWTYSGTWGTASNANTYTPTIHSTTASGAYAEMPFTGTGIAFDTVKGPGYGKVDVTVDGVAVTGSPFDLYAASNTYKQRIIDISGLTNAAHTLRITARSDKNASSSALGFIADQAVVSVTTTTSTGTGGVTGSFDANGIEVTNLKVTPTSGDTNTSFIASFGLRVSASKTINDIAVAVRRSDDPAPIPGAGDLDFPHLGVTSIGPNSTAQTMTTGPQLFVTATTYNIHVAYQLIDGGTWVHNPTTVAFTVTAAAVPTPTDGTNPLLSVGRLSGLTWNSGMIGGLGGNGGSLQQTVANEARGRRSDIIPGVAVGDGGLGDIAALSTLSSVPKDRPVIMPVTPFPPGGTWAKAAAGAYDDTYRQMGASAASKNNGYPVVIRLGWEWNGEWYYHSAWGPTSGQTQVTTATFIAAWRRMYTAAKAGAGAHPELCVINWSLAGLDQKSGNPSPFAFWPGDAYVDIVGVDIYDYKWVGPSTSSAVFYSSSGIGTLWNTVYAFAQQHGKKMALDEWGCQSATNQPGAGGDNPTFIQLAYEWIRAHKAGLAYETYFQAVPHDGPDSQFYPTTVLPNARTRYQQEMAAG